MSNFINYYFIVLDTNYTNLLEFSGHGKQMGLQTAEIGEKSWGNRARGVRLQPGHDGRIRSSGWSGEPFMPSQLKSPSQITPETGATRADG